jgi:undecaprenyl diphosphate synthase
MAVVVGRMVGATVPMVVGGVSMGGVGRGREIRRAHSAAMVVRMLGPGVTVAVAVSRVPLGGGVDLPPHRQFGDGGDRDGNVAMGGADASGTEPDRRGRHRRDPQGAQRLATADHIGQGVQRADLVEVHGIGVDPVGARLRVRQQAERGQGPLAGDVGQRGGGQCGPDRRPTAVGRILHQDADPCLGGPLPAPDDLLGLQPNRSGGDGLDRGRDRCGVRSGVQQGAQEHVAGDPGGDVEPRVHARHSRPGCRTRPRRCRRCPRVAPRYPSSVSPQPPRPHPSGAVAPRIPAKLLPRHVAIVMDGNGRWAKERNLPRTDGHARGEAALLDTIHGAVEAGVRYLSAYAFSTENWKRSPDEVRWLMGFNRDVIHRRRDELNDLGVKIVWAGRAPRLWKSVINELKTAEKMSAHNTTLTLQFCVNYGGRAEIVDAVRALARDAAAGRIDPDRISEKSLASHLYAPEVPDVDLFIRSSGEQRTSNFLLWQMAYAEMVFLDRLWPDFDRRDLWQALDLYARRDRRYGGAVPNQVTP